MYTQCPYCKNTINVEEFQTGKKCRYCGREFATYERRIFAGLSLVFLVLAYVGTFLFFSSQGGWSKADPANKVGAIAILAPLTLLLVSWHLTDWIFVKVLKIKGNNPAWWVAIALVALYKLTPMDTVIEKMLLNILG